MLLQPAEGLAGLALIAWRSETASPTAPKENDASEPAGLTFTLARQSLLDHATAQGGVNRTFIGTMHGHPEHFVGDPLTACKASERLGLENAHPFPRTLTMLLSDISLRVILVNLRLDATSPFGCTNLPAGLSSRKPSRKIYRKQAYCRIAPKALAAGAKISLRPEALLLDLPDSVQGPPNTAAISL